MTLFLFILGILVVFAIARYNESNKLFWILFISYVLGFTGVKVILDTFKDKEQSSQSLNQAYPTQELFTTDGTCMFTITNVDNTTTVKVTSNPVSQVNTPDYVESLNTLSVYGVTHGQYFHILPNPPNGKFFYDTS